MRIVISGVRVTTDPYVRAHGAEPKGVRSWAFLATDGSLRPYRIHLDGEYEQCLSRAVQLAVASKRTHLEVLP